MAKKNIKSAAQRPMTKIEKQATDNLYKEFDNVLGTSYNTGWKLTGSELSKTIQYVIYGITIKGWNDKQAYQEWEDSPVGPLNFKKIYKRGEEMLKHRLDEINNAKWYCITFTTSYGSRESRNINADTIEEARSIAKNMRYWACKITGLYHTNWNGKKFTRGERIAEPSGQIFVTFKYRNSSYAIECQNEATAIKLAVDANSLADVKNVRMNRSGRINRDAQIYSQRRYYETLGNH